MDTSRPSPPGTTGSGRGTARTASGRSSTPTATCPPPPLPTVAPTHVPTVYANCDVRPLPPPRTPRKWGPRAFAPHREEPATSAQVFVGPWEDNAKQGRGLYVMRNQTVLRSISYDSAEVIYEKVYEKHVSSAKSYEMLFRCCPGRGPTASCAASASASRCRRPRAPPRAPPRVLGVLSPAFAPPFLSPAAPSEGHGVSD